MTTNPFNLNNQTVLVVGAGSGIGAATARLANFLGARVILCGRNLEPLNLIKKSLAEPQRSEICLFDYLNAPAVGVALESIGQINHIVIPAVADENKKRGRFLELSRSTMDSSFDKFWGQLNVIRAASHKMPKGGSFVLFSSIAALKQPGPDAGLSIMNSVQSAVLTLGRSLALELAPLRVNVIAPGIVLTNVWSDQQKKDLGNWMETTLPAKRAGVAEDVAQAAISLITNPYITGAVLTVDGGLHLQ